MRSKPTAMNAHKTGLIVYGIDRQIGGIGRYTEELAAALSRLGVMPALMEAGSMTGGNKILVLRGARRLPALLTFGQLQIGWLARRHGLTLVHDPTGSMPLLLTMARRVSTLHDVVPFVYPETTAWLTWLTYHLWLPLAAPRVDAILTVSESSRRDILRFLPVCEEKIFVIPEAAHSRFRPLDLKEVEPVLDRYGVKRPYILYVGSLEARKNLPRLLEAFDQLRKDTPGWKLVIVGARKWKSAPIYATVERLRLEPDVLFTGFVEEEDLPAIYCGADCFVFPSLYEGFGLPVLEAMACGIPVVTSNTSSLPEVAGGAALLVDAKDIQSIAAAIGRVLTEPDLAQDLRSRGLKRASEFSWERTARETIAVYQRIIGTSDN